MENQIIKDAKAIPHEQRAAAYEAALDKMSDADASAVNRFVLALIDRVKSKNNIIPMSRAAALEVAVNLGVFLVERGR